MKAEEKVRKFMLKKFPTNEYWDCPVPKHHWEVIQEYADDYAKEQIQKDRKRILHIYYNENDSTDFNHMIKNAPIILD